MVSPFSVSLIFILHEAALFADIDVTPVCRFSDTWSSELNKTLSSSFCSLPRNDIIHTALDNDTEHLTILVKAKIPIMSLKYFADLMNVHVLNISYNHIRGVQDLGVFRTTLEVLDMRCNRFSEIKLEYFRGLTYLKFLLLNDNMIQVIGISSWTDLIRLSVLDMLNNRLDEIKKSDFTGLVGLDKLILGNNKIFSIEVGAFLGLNKLRYLDLRNNNLYRLNADSFRGLEQVTTLRVSDNSFKAIPNNAFQGFKRLDLLDVGGNQIEVLEQDAFHAINVTKIRYCNDLILTFIARVAFRNCEGLQAIEICNNKHLKYVDKKAFAEDISLQMVNLSYNNISLIDALSSLNPKAVLDLQGNILQFACINKWVCNTNFTVKGIDTGFCNNTIVHQEPHGRCEPELIHSLRKKYNVLTGDTIKLHCFSQGRPLPNITWVTMSSNASDQVVNNIVAKGNTFIFKHLANSDSGHYACYAENDVSEAKFNFMLNVKGRNLSLVILAISSTTATLTWTGVKTSSLSFVLSWRNIDSNNTVFSSILHPFPLWKSYRIADLTPSSTYILCLSIVNSTQLHSCAPITTKGNDSTSGIFNAKSLVLGIAAAGSIFFILVISCISCFIEKYNKKEKLGCVVPHSISQDVFLDDISDTSPIAYENQMAELYENNIEQLETFPKSSI